MTSEVHIFRVPAEKDGRDHEWTCPKAAPLLRTGDCNCGALPLPRQHDTKGAE